MFGLYSLFSFLLFFSRDGWDWNGRKSRDVFLLYVGCRDYSFVLIFAVPTMGIDNVGIHMIDGMGRMRMME
jgi:hypothetical protein